MQHAQTITLVKYNGVPCAITAQVRTAGVADLAAFVALQRDVQDAMPDKSLYVPSTQEELAQDLEHQLCIGVWVSTAALVAGECADIGVKHGASGAPCAADVCDEDTQILIAYATMRYDGDTPHNYANYFDLPEGEVAYWANLDSVLVRPAFRGNQLQQKLDALCIAWRRPDIIGIGCTVSPENTHSLANTQAAGFQVHSRRTMYGKHDRYLLWQRLAPLPGKYRNFKGGEYRVISTATHSETLAPMVVYQALYGERGIWVRPAEMWFEWVERGDYKGPRFVYLGAEET